MDVIAYGTQTASASLEPLRFTRRDVQAGEIAIEISHCGVCHSDLHQARDDWDNTVWPCIPGHEIVGKVIAVGEGVTRFAEGDRAGVGCMVNSCQQCDMCKADQEQFCTGLKSCTLTYNGPKQPDGSNTYGGYSTGIVVREEFAITIPDAIDSEHAGPILCAGITTYQPMKWFGLKEGHALGVAGIGGLGHMAVQIGKALGAKVVALTTSADKVDAIRELGADEVVLMDDDDALEKHAASLDLIVNTIPYKHDINPYIKLMKPRSQIAVVGNFLGFDNVETSDLAFQHIGITGSLIGGIADTQEVVDLCAEHGIRPEIEMIRMDQIDEAFERMQEEDVRFRHVIDMESLRQDTAAAQNATKVPDPDRGDVVGS